MSLPYVPPEEPVNFCWCGEELPPDQAFCGDDCQTASHEDEAAFAQAEEKTESELFDMDERAAERMEREE